MTNETNAALSALKAKLQDLLKQATEEQSHFYVGSVVRETLAYLEAKSTPKKSGTPIIDDTLLEEVVEDLKELRAMISPLVQERHHKDIGERIALLEASQREAPVAEAYRLEMDSEAMKIAEGYLTVGDADDLLMELSKHLETRLAERPSVTNVSRDWTEDFAHENGNYQCICSRCKSFFQGHKRRIICKVCATTPMDTAPGKAATWREFMDQAPKFGQRQDSMLDQLADLRLVANKLGFYDAADYLKGPLK